MASSRSPRVLHNLQKLAVQTSRHPLFPRTPRVLPTSCAVRLSSTQSSPHQPPNSSVDPTEVSHFNALASSWWDPHGPSRLLHLMNPLRHEFITRCRTTVPITIPTTPSQLRYLDIGCGGGIFAESAARLPGTLSVTAIDPTPEVLKIAEAHRRRDPTLLVDGRLTYLNQSIEDLTPPTSPAEGYDVVTIFEVIEHVNAPGPFLERVLQHVKPGGWLVLSTIARTWTSWVVTNVVAEDVLGIVPKGTHDWEKYVNETELREWFGKRGWGSNGGMKTMGVVYVPGLGWKEVPGGEGWGNYFFGVRRDS
ncbi:hexaprenyldihydroxybenzoate methyltransferase mitochondrial precursor [Melanomma pulvis-pyrius CBS 109.77]|uniref:Ubiquinone biosynthesis O-methyltransferase, mitochondrial n=1 Tax=Melanomma pulvis-pyrius CBS 109.77 TaxID=1314802 RepID=A0A6A6XV97_9PLEO|nr:hexaprenyldihydroxybenzoate methyltransferase mitochondrial precursor [Melanomma pulvis-pyrius CBS 109.77]